MVHWARVRSGLSAGGLSDTEILKLEEEIISNQIEQNQFILDNLILIKTTPGPIDGGGICGQPRYGNVIIWRL